jgi:alkylhydroperoxidase/carboxymuconolactone decarboxylase family protein YurZ
LGNGVTKSEIREVILHTTMYAVWPVGASAVRIAKEVFDEWGRIM